MYLNIFLLLIYLTLNIIISYVFLFVFIKTCLYFCVNYYRKVFDKNKKLDSLINDSVFFLKKELNIPENIRIRIIPEYHLGIIGVEGFLDPHTGIYNVHINMNNTQYMILRTVSHEMVHVKQFQSGRLQSFNTTSMVLYEGSFYSQKTPYSKRPWEKEAFEKEAYLCDKFYKEKNIKKPFYNYLLPI